MMEPLLATALWTVAAFLIGSLPFSVWVGRRVLHKDITQYGDANPGATNVMRAGSKTAGVLALALDLLKGCIPVSLAYYAAGFTDWRITPIALAPIAGHAFSPLLHWRGGKAMATTLGVWMALTVWEGPLIGGLLLWLFSWLVGANGWAVLFMFLCMLPILLVLPPGWHLLGQPLAPALTAAIWVGNLVIVAYKYRADFAHAPVLRRSRKARTLESR